MSLQTDGPQSNQESPPPGRIYDQSATYTLAFQLAALAILISTVALWLALGVAKKKV
jgi:hypothetical protein